MKNTYFLIEKSSIIIYLTIRRVPLKSNPMGTLWELVPIRFRPSGGTLWQFSSFQVGIRSEITVFHSHSHVCSMHSSHSCALHVSDRGHPVV